MKRPITPATTVIVYAICGITWILATDALLMEFQRELSLRFLWFGQHFKGIIYILFSSFLLHGLIKRNMSRLEISQKAYRRMFRENPQPMWIFSTKDFRFLEVNDAAIRLYGYSREEFLRMTILDIRPAEDIPRLRQSSQEAGTITSGQWRHYKKDGSLMYVRVEAFVTSYDNQPAEVVSIFDITEKHLADEALNKQEQLLKTMINSTENMVWAVNTQLQFVAFNNAFRHNALLLDGLNQPSPFWEEYYLKCLNGEKQQLEYETPGNNGNWKYTEITLEPIIHQEKITGVAGQARDVTERKEHELTLKKALERYDLLSLATNDAVWDYDIASNVVTWTDKMQQLFEFEGMEGDISYWEQRIHQGDRKRVMDSVMEAIAVRKHRWQGEYRMIARKGEYRHVISRGYILYNEKGEPFRMIGALQDIEDKVRQQEEIRKLSLIASMTHNPVIISDPEARIEWVNKSFENLSGYTLEEVKGLHPSSFLHGPLTRKETMLEIQEKLGSSQPCVVEILNYNSNGEPYWVLMDITPIVDGSGQLERLIIIQTDITEKKKFVQQLEEKNKLLMEVAYISSHRLRKPVASMLGVMSLMDKENLCNPENERLIGFIEQLTYDMDAMLHEMAEKCNLIYQSDRAQNGSSGKQP